jgi:hypothetical protein
LKNRFYEKQRRRYFEAANASRQPAYKNIECYDKQDWLGRTVKKTDEELWDEYALVPIEFLDFDDWV